MSVTTSVKFLSPEEIAARDIAEAAHLKFADLAFVFRDRALRLRQLAAGHPMRDFLVFMADVADAQHTVLAAPRTVKLPSKDFLAEAARSGAPALEFPHWGLNEEWREDLSDLLAALAPRVPTGAAHEVIAGLRSASVEHLQQQAERLLSGIMIGLDYASAPLVGAALQVYWTRLVNRTQAAFPDLAFGPIDNGRVCPCCGGQPVASVARIGGDDAGSRYLHCSLCQTGWHLVRITCAHCESTKAITYQELEPADGAEQPTYHVPKGAVRAECCGECGHYLKIVDMAKDAHVDPVADDLASVALDLLVSETGALRHGLNYMLLWGDPAEDALAHQAAGAT
jgi:FdhE protein